MIDLGNIHMRHDLDRGIILTIDTIAESKYNGLEGEGENFKEAITQLAENVEAVY